MTKNKDRLGEIRKNKEILGGYEMKIIKYNNAHDILIEFQDENKSKVHTQYGNFEKGNVKNPFHPSVYGIGYLGEGKYKANENNKHTKAYNTWMDMLRRCYDPYHLNRHPTYIDCYVCEEWHNFQNFAKWFYKHYYEIEGQRIELDKDILVKGNKIYSPETCIFVPQRINYLFLKKENRRGEYPIGVTPHKANKKLEVQCNTLEKQERLGFFPLNRPFQTFTCYKNFKENYIKQVADEYKELIPKKVYDALYKYKVEIND